MEIKNNNLQQKYVENKMQELAQYVKRELPAGWGFVIMAFPFGEGGRLNYVSNGNREDVVKALYEFIEKTEGHYGEHT